MAFEDKYLDVLQNIEFPIQVVYKENPDLTDYDALSAIESLIEFYTAEERKRPPRQFKLSDKSIEIYEGVKEMCDFRLGRDVSENNSVEGIPNPISIGEMLHCLKTIKSSINKWTKWNGRQGYLNFVKGYMPYV
jgi:hypothetical protein